MENETRQQPIPADKIKDVDIFKRFKYLGYWWEIDEEHAEREGINLDEYAEHYRS